jgi:hypothetical protein
MTKAFRNHKNNGVYLAFPNGNGVSTIWGSGSYTDNHDAEILTKDGELDYQRMYRENNEGSMTAEVMVDCGEELARALQEKFNGAGNTVIGYLSIMDWLEVIQRIANEKTEKTK